MTPEMPPVKAPASVLKNVGVKNLTEVRAMIKRHKQIGRAHV